MERRRKRARLAPRVMPKDGQLLARSVVLCFVNPGAFAILLAIYLAMFLRGQGSAVSLPILPDFLVDTRLLLLQTRGLTRRKLAILHAFSDSLLLVPLALIHLVRLRQHVAHTTQHATQQQRTGHHAHQNAFHVQSPFLVRLSAASGLLNEPLARRFRPSTLKSHHVRADRLHHA